MEKSKNRVNNQDVNRKQQHNKIDCDQDITCIHRIPESEFY